MPFLQKPGQHILIWNIIIILFIAILLPFIPPLANVFGFVRLPGTFIGIMVVFIAVYLVLVEIMKRWFYRRFNPQS